MSDLYRRLKGEGYDFFAGVPCSMLKEFTDDLIANGEYVPCTREDQALALCVGAHLAGKKPVCFMQNAGLGHCVDIIASLLKPYGISVHLVISNRTTPKHHEMMGSITEELLQLLDYWDYTVVKDD